MELVEKFLSKKGKHISFPKSENVAQAQEAKHTKYNATAGIARQDDGGPMHLSAIADAVHLDPEKIFTYAPSFGNMQLRTKWQKMLKVKNPSIHNCSLPVVTHALTHALLIAGHLFVDEGDNIILPEPFWGNYKLLFEQNFGAKLDTFPLFDIFNNNTFNIKGLAKKLQSPGKKIVLLNFPNNPTGYTPTIEEESTIIALLKKAAEKDPIVLICDDAYFGLFYEENHESIAAKIDHENILCVKIDGITKEEYAWGLRVGFITFLHPSLEKLAPLLEDKAAAVVRGTISNVSNLSQNLVLGAFTSKTYEQEKKENYFILKKRYEKIKTIIGQYKNFTPLPFNSGYFFCVKPKRDAEEVRKILLTRDIGVVATAGLVRIAYSVLAKSDIENVLSIINEVCA